MTTTTHPVDSTTRTCCGGIGRHTDECTDELLHDPAGWEEDEDYTLRVQLGLRPISWKHTMGPHAPPHSDQRPCPAWCYLSEDGRHEVEVESPMIARHSLGTTVDVAASLYEGRFRRGDGPGEVGTTTAAKIRLGLEQRGQDDPVIPVQLLDGEPPYTQSLKLTVADARDMVKALNYLIGLAGGAQS